MLGDVIVDRSSLFCLGLSCLRLGERERFRWLPFNNLNDLVWRGAGATLSSDSGTINFSLASAVSENLVHFDF
jgi:hypothetical protein